MAAHGHAQSHDHKHGQNSLTNHGAPHVHVMPLGIYLAIFATLMVLTGVTVAVAYVNLGQFNKVVALGIASFKATLVVLYFMHVKYASKLTQLFAVTGIFFLFILLSMTMIDYSSRMWVDPPALLH